MHEVSIFANLIIVSVAKAGGLLLVVYPVPADLDRAPIVDVTIS